MQRLPRLLSGVLVLAAVVLFIWWLGTSGPGLPGNGDEPADSTLEVEAGSRPTDPLAGAAPPANVPRVPQLDAPADPQLVAELEAWAATLRARRTPDKRAVRAELARLKALVHEASPDEAAEALIALLETGEDHPTGLMFMVGAEGVMDETPSFRTALLDLLGQTDPRLSAEYARQLLGATDSADEYALALRNLAWTDPDGRLTTELREAFRAMLARPDWQGAPTRGFLEAFDLAVVTGAVEEVAALIPPTAGNEAEGPATRAAFIALDRLMLSQPETVMTWLGQNPAAFTEAPPYRASLLSRLDVEVPAQRELLARYLQRDDHGPGELAYFARLFPNGNFFSGYRLVTNPVDSTVNMPARDRATLAVLREWATQPEFAARRADLEAMINRLENMGAPSPGP